MLFNFFSQFFAVGLQGCPYLVILTGDVNEFASLGNPEADDAFTVFIYVVL